MRHLVLLFTILFAACADIQDPALLKYEQTVAQLEQRLAQDEISDLELQNLKLQAHQIYLEARRREEKQFMNDVDRQTKAQNQEINSVAMRRR